jgi:hypothetical protein
MKAMCRTIHHWLNDFVKARCIAVLHALDDKPSFKDNLPLRGVFLAQRLVVSWRRMCCEHTAFECDGSSNDHESMVSAAHPTGHWIDGDVPATLCPFVVKKVWGNRGILLPVNWR